MKSLLLLFGSVGSSAVGSCAVAVASIHIRDSLSVKQGISSKLLQHGLDSLWKRACPCRTIVVASDIRAMTQRIEGEQP